MINDLIAASQFGLVHGQVSAAHTPLQTEAPLALTQAFANEAAKQTWWKAFLRKDAAGG